MTELQMGLIGLGATAVVVVLGYNKWQEMRQRKLAEQLLSAGHADVLLDESEPDGAEPGIYADEDAAMADLAAAMTVSAPVGADLAILSSSSIICRLRSESWVSTILAISVWLCCSTS